MVDGTCTDCGTTRFLVLDKSPYGTCYGCLLVHEQELEVWQEKLRYVRKFDYARWLVLRAHPPVCPPAVRVDV